MAWSSLEWCWRMSGRKKSLRVRFSDWTHEIKYFEIMGVSADGRRFVGKLDNGERMSFPKNSFGWSIYYPGNEFGAHAV